jgi:hypothetical protein
MVAQQGRERRVLQESILARPNKYQTIEQALNGLVDL